MFPMHELPRRILLLFQYFCQQEDEDPLHHRAVAHKRKVILGKVLAYIVIRLGILQVIALLSCQAGKVLDHREQA